MKKIRIAVILNSLANTGPNIIAKEIIDHMVTKVEIIDVFYFDNKVELDFAVNTYKIKFLNDINFNDYDIFQSHVFRSDLYLYLKRKKIKGKIVSTLHQYNELTLIYHYNYILAWFINKIWYLVLSKKDLIVTLSFDMMNYYKPKIKNVKLTYIYNGITPSMGDEGIELLNYNKILELKKNYILIGTVGRLNKLKGIDQLIVFLASDDRFALLIIGEGEEKKALIELAVKNNVNERCLFLGYNSNPQKYYKYFDIFILASKIEGLPIVILEAAFFKIPIVSSKLPAIIELFNEEECTTFDFNDITSLRNAIHHIMQNKELFASNMFNKYNKLLTGSKMANEYLIAYSDLLLKKND
jgi:glycosyltransferase involved in cell wall biosynthesis